MANQQAASPVRSASLTGAQVTGASQPLFPLREFAEIQARFIHNPSASATIWINPVGGTAVANGPDCIGLAPLGSIRGEWTNLTTVLGVAGQPITAFER